MHRKALQAEEKKKEKRRETSKQEGQESPKR
jgi:hypothetical protein